MAGDETESAVISGRFYSGYEPSIVGQIGFIHGAEIALDATAAANALHQATTFMDLDQYALATTSERRLK